MDVGVAVNVPMIGVTGVTPPTGVGVLLGVAPVTVTTAVDVMLPPVPVAVSVYVVVVAGVTTLLDALHGTLPTPLSIVQVVAPVMDVHDSVAGVPGVTDVGVAVSARPDGAVWLPQPAVTTDTMRIASESGDRRGMTPLLNTRAPRRAFHVGSIRRG